MAGEVFLAFALVSGLLTWNVYRPIRAPMPPAAVSSVLGWNVGEFALHHIALQLALMLAFAASVGLGEVAGKLGLVVLPWRRSPGHRMPSNSLHRCAPSTCATPWNVFSVKSGAGTAAVPGGARRCRALRPTP
jgi:hypothetical protein